MQFSIVLHKAMMSKPDFWIFKRISVRGREIAVSWIHHIEHKICNYRITEGERQRDEEQKKREMREMGRFWVSCSILISI